MAPPRYLRRKPELSPLYAAVHRGLPALLSRCAAADHALPSFVERELGRYLDCGILAYGFCRVHCDHCGHDRVVAFSCKGRGFCPSCLGRQMAETGAHLVDYVLPHVPYRQWVLTLPPPLRYLVAYDRELLAVVLDAFQRTLFGHLKHRAKRTFGLRSVDHALPGSVTVIQRAGSALNLNVHLHTLATDGVFIQEHPDAKPTFRALPAPSDAEVAHVAWHTCLRTLGALRKRGLWLDEDTTDDPLTHAEPALATLARASVTGTLALGPRAGNRPMTLRAELPTSANDDTPGLVQTPGYAFNLHAKRRVPAHDRKGLERLCRYFLRPPVANDRLRWADGNTLALRLVRPWRDGTTHVFFTPEELVQRLVPLVFPPRVNRIRYHGIFAPNAKLRKHIVPRPEEDTPSSTCGGHAEASRSGESPAGAKISRPPRPGWADLMARVFAIDVLECPRCRSRMQRIAFITQESVIHAFLDSVGLPADSPLNEPLELERGNELDGDAAA